MPSPAGRDAPVRSGQGVQQRVGWRGEPTGPVQLTTAATLSTVPSLRVTSRRRRASPRCRRWPRQRCGAAVPDPPAGLVDAARRSAVAGGHAVAVGVPGARVVSEEASGGRRRRGLATAGRSPDAGRRWRRASRRSRRRSRSTCARTVARTSARECGAGDAGGRRHGRRRGQHVVGWDHVVCARRRGACGRGGRRDRRRRPWSGRCRPGAGRRRAGCQSTGREPAGRRREPRVPSRCRLGAGREHDRSRHDGLLVVEAHDQAVAGPVDVDDPASRRTRRALRGTRRRWQQALDVAAEDPRGAKSGAGTAGRGGCGASGEVVGVARERAHAAGRDVEQVAVVRGGVGLPRPVVGTGSTSSTRNREESPVTRWEAASVPPAPAPTTTTHSRPRSSPRRRPLHSPVNYLTNDSSDAPPARVGGGEGESRRTAVTPPDA